MTFLPKLNGGFSSVLQLAVGGGAGAGAALIVMSLVDKQPLAVIDTFRQWGAMPILGVMMLAMISRGFDRVVDQVVPAMRENATASQRLADAVGEIARKEDTEAYEQKVLLGHIATTMEKVLVRLDSFDQQQENTKARGVGAGT